MKKYTIKIEPYNRIVHYTEGITIVDILTEEGLDIRTPCGGKGICGKCSISVTGTLSPKSNSEEKFFPNNENLRLACITKIEGNCVISYTPKHHIATQQKINTKEKDLGIAIDIGTTSIQISIVNISTGESHPLDSFLNPQRRYGHDIISRISSSIDEKTYNKLTDSVRVKIISSIKDFLEFNQIERSRIKKISIAGNTTMLYFFTAIDVQPLGQYPYKTEKLNFTKSDVMFLLKEFSSDTEIYIMPPASAYIGGDLIGGLGLTHKKGFKQNTFFIDIGTNGEIFLRNSMDNIFSTSCAMGPALEGMDISCGTTAVSGAINHFFIENDSDNGKILKMNIIGESQPFGITGTGLIDLLAILLEEKIVLNNGSFNKNLKNDTLSISNLFFNDDGSAIHIAENIFITAKDIRNIQLAKGASLAASELLLLEAKTSEGSIENVIIAGSFGENLNLDNFKRLRFIPEFKNARFTFMGNTSLKSCQEAIIDNEFITETKILRDRTSIVELSTHEDFNDEFLVSLEF